MSFGARSTLRLPRGEGARDLARTRKQPVTARARAGGCRVSGEGAPGEIEEVMEIVQATYYVHLWNGSHDPAVERSSESPT